MKLLLDQNLPRSLLRHIQTSFPGSEHVRTLGMDTTSDRDIYAYARDHDFTIASKDSDFRQLSFVYGAPPKVIWFRIGNCTVDEVLDLLLSNISRIEDFSSGPESFLVLEPEDRQEQDLFLP